YAATQRGGEGGAMTKKLDGIIDASFESRWAVDKRRSLPAAAKSEVKQALLARLIASRTEEERDLCLRNLTTAWANTGWFPLNRFQFVLLNLRNFFRFHSLNSF